MTLFGIIWIFLCVFCLLKQQSTWLFLLLFSCIFQATAVINLDEKGISPLVVTELFFLLKYSRYLLSKFSINLQLCCFFGAITYCTIMVFVSIYLFSGIEVFVPYLGIDNQAIYGGQPLSFSFSNLTQICYLLLHFLTLLTLYNIKNSLSLCKVYLAVNFCILFVCLFGYFEFILKSIGLYSFINDFIYNNEGYAQLSLSTVFEVYRLNSTFLEASYVGAFLASSFWLSFYQRNLMLSVLCFIAIVLNLSGTGILSLCFGGILYIFMSKNKFYNFLFLAICLSIVLIVLYYSPYFNLIEQMITLKLSSESGISRMKGLIVGWNAYLDTYMLGVGIGSHRGGSFLFDILANLGLLGSSLFFLFIYFSIRQFVQYSLNSFSLGMILFSITLLFAQIVAIPDLSFSIFWFWVFISVIISTKAKS